MELDNSKILITAGPTKEKWDPVRYLTSYSSGKTGVALAKKAVQFGASVTLVSGADDPGLNQINFIHIESAIDMLEKVKDQIIYADIFIASAAVCDFRPVPAEKKIKKNDNIEYIKLERNPDILKWVSENYPEKFIVGFALEDEMDIQKGINKKQLKKCDLMILNDITNLRSLKRDLIIISDNENIQLNGATVDEVAAAILEQCRNTQKKN